MTIEEYLHSQEIEADLIQEVAAHGALIMNHEEVNDYGWMSGSQKRNYYH